MRKEHEGVLNGISDHVTNQYFGEAISSRERIVIE